VTEFNKSQERVLLGLNGSGHKSVGPVPEPFRGTFASYIQMNAKSDPICTYRAKLVQILQSPTPYDPKDFLPQVEAVPQLEFERVVLLSRVRHMACNHMLVWRTFFAVELTTRIYESTNPIQLEKYDECIKILVRDVKDYQGVEIFCLNAGVFRNPRRGHKSHGSEAFPKEPLGDVDKKRQLFMMLLQEYLHMAQDQGGMALTLHLLDSQSSYLDVSEVMTERNERDHWRRGRILTRIVLLSCRSSTCYLHSGQWNCFRDISCDRYGEAIMSSRRFRSSKVSHWEKI